MAQHGVSYLNGTGVKRDLPAAFAFLSLAAEQGDASAMNSLAGMYEKGLGTDADRKKAIELYAKAARVGSRLSSLSFPPSQPSRKADL